MTKISLFLCLVFATAAMSSTKVVYGVDNRKEYYQVNSFYKKLADATAGMIENIDLLEMGDMYAITSNVTLKQTEGLCEGEKFASQPLAPLCSGFLVGEDTLVTAGHCFESLGMPADVVCDNFSWVFDYHVEEDGTVNKGNIDQSKIYKCAKVIESKFISFLNLDYAVIKLDRKVTDRAPIAFRKEGKIASTSRLVVIGHPSGLPTKISDGGTILRNDKEETFTTTLDTFHGNSGSAVFDARTGMIEGILVSGKTDYTPVADGKGGMCQIVNVCDMNGKNCLDSDPRDPAGEEVTRITVLSEAINNALSDSL